MPTLLVKNRLNIPNFLAMTGKGRAERYIPTNRWDFTILGYLSLITNIEQSFSHQPLEFKNCY